MDKPQHSFYTHWVSQSFKQCQGTVGKGTSDEPKLAPSYILQWLGSDSTVADWQVSQAHGAIEVYYEQFRGIVLAKPHTADAHVQGTSRPVTEESISDTNPLSRQSDVGGSRE